MPQPKSSGSSSSRSSGSGGAAAKRSSSSAKTAAKRSSSSAKTAAKRSSSSGKTAAKRSASSGKTAAKSSSAAKSTAKSSSAGTSTAKASASRAKPAAAKSSGAAAKKSSGAAAGKRASAKGSASRSTAKRSPAKPAAKASGRSATAAGAKPSRARASARASTSAGAAGGDDLRARMAEVRERLLGSVTIPASRLQEAVDETVRRGRMTRADAEELMSNLLSVGRTQTEAVLADIEQLLGRGRQTASRSGDRVLRQVDKARRAAGIGGFPIMGYDDLTAGQIADRLSDLTPAQLRKVRDYERRNANRKSVLSALEKRLA